MRAIKTYNLPTNLIEILNSEVRRGYRSQFVEKAIKEKLDGQLEFSLHDITTIKLASHLRNSRFTELTKMEKIMLEDLIIRIEGSQ